MIMRNCLDNESHGKSIKYFPAAIVWNDICY